MHDLDLVCDTGVGGARPGECNQRRIEFHQARPHVGATPMGGHDVDHIPPLPGADAHDADRPGCGVIEHLTHSLLHKAESHRESGVGVLIALVPPHPVCVVTPDPDRRHLAEPRAAPPAPPPAPPAPWLPGIVTGSS